MKEAVFCADIGTSSLKGALISPDGEVLAFARIRFDGMTVPDCWLSALKSALDQMRKISQQTSINSICISGNGPTIVSDTFIHLWNSPNGTPEENEAYSRICGRSLFLPRLVYYKEHFSKQWEASKYVFSGPEYLIYKLTGTAVTILPEQRFEAAYWNETGLEKCGISKDKLPPFVKPGFCAGNLADSTAEFLELSHKTKVYCGSPDFVAALIGTATLKEGRLCDRAGSSEGLNFCVKKTVTDSRIRFLPSIISDLWNASVLLPDSGARFAKFKKNSEYKNLTPAETVDALLKDQHSEGFKLIYGIAEELKTGIKLLEEITGISIESMRITGGQTHNNSWNQFKADVLGIRLEATKLLDAELMGDAITAFAGMGIFDSIAEGAEALVKPAQIFEPRSHF